MKETCTYHKGSKRNDDAEYQNPIHSTDYPLATKQDGTSHFTFNIEDLESREDNTNIGIGYHYHM